MWSRGVQKFNLIKYYVFRLAMETWPQWHLLASSLVASAPSLASLSLAFPYPSLATASTSSTPARSGGRSGRRLPPTGVPLACGEKCRPATCASRSRIRILASCWVVGAATEILQIPSGQTHNKQWRRLHKFPPKI